MKGLLLRLVAIFPSASAVILSRMGRKRIRQAGGSFLDSTENAAMTNGKRPRWHAMGPFLTMLGVLLLVLSPVGYRLGWSAWIVPLASVAVCLAASIVPVLGIVHARSVPPIHDITTDTAMPPVFVALAASRTAAPNGLDYGGPEVASAQKQAYPDLVTLQSTLAPDALFERALQAARESGWQLVDANRSEGRIEAVDTSLLYGFKDDIVIRIRGDANGSRLDVRSASRVGRSDLGVNAARIRKYLRRLKEQTSS
jgi:uncharacterized protein (DUF1499 family)